MNDCKLGILKLNPQSFMIFEVDAAFADFKLLEEALRSAILDVIIHSVVLPRVVTVTVTITVMLFSNANVS